MNKILFSCLLLIVGFTSCKKSSKEPASTEISIIGKWNAMRFHMETFENGKSIDNSDGMDVDGGYEFNADGTGAFISHGNVSGFHYTYSYPEIMIRDNTGTPPPYDVKITEATPKKLTFVRVVNYTTSRRVDYTYYLSK